MLDAVKEMIAEVHFPSLQGFAPLAHFELVDSVEDALTKVPGIVEEVDVLEYSF